MGEITATENVAGLEHEPTASEVLKRGVHLVCFSGDKLFAGPQAGIIAGQAKLVAALKREPFFRALRCDKLILSSLQTLTDLYLSGADVEIPLFQMMRVSNSELRLRAEKIMARLAGLPLAGRVVEGNSRIGGGSLPRSSIL